MCDKGFIFNSSNCECECDKSCNIGEYLDYSNCKNVLIEECTENIDEVKINNENKDKDKNEHKYNFFVVYIVLFSIILTISIGIGIYFVYRKCVNCNKYELPY